MVNEIDDNTRNLIKIITIENTDDSTAGSWFRVATAIGASSTQQQSERSSAPLSVTSEGEYVIIIFYFCVGFSFFFFFWDLVLSVFFFIILAEVRNSTEYYVFLCSPPNPLVLSASLLQ